MESWAQSSARHPEKVESHSMPITFFCPCRTTSRGTNRRCSQHFAVIREFQRERLFSVKNPPRPSILFSLVQSFMTGFFVFAPFVAESHWIIASYPAPQRTVRQMPLLQTRQPSMSAKQIKRTTNKLDKILNGCIVMHRHF